MNLNLKKTSCQFGYVLLAASALLGSHRIALAQETSAPVAAPAKAFKDERALGLLKAMSDTLAGSKTLAFSVRGIVPTPSPTGQYVSLFAASRVVMQRPDKLFVAARGDLFPSDVVYDGKAVTAISLDRRFYAQREAAGGAIESILAGQQPGSDATRPFLDLLVPDPYALLTKDLASAFWVGRSTVGGVETDHLAFTAEGLDWEVWVGAKDKLPRLMVISYRSGDRQPTFTVEFSDWKLGAPVASKTFIASIPKDAVKLEFKQIDQVK